MVFLPLSFLLQTSKKTRVIQAQKRPCFLAPFHTLHSVVTVAISILDSLAATRVCARCYPAPGHAQSPTHQLAGILFLAGQVPGSQRFALDNCFLICFVKIAVGSFLCLMQKM
jgi:hypothetical protein